MKELADENNAPGEENAGNGAVAEADEAAAQEVDASEGGVATAEGTAFGAPDEEAGAQPELNEELSPAPAAPAGPAPRQEVPNGRSYEIIYIARTGDAEMLEKTTGRVRELIEATGGAVDNVRTSETRRLAYAIERQTEGIYVVINARFTKETTNELDRLLKLEESVLRHMVLREEF
ncbi:MAG: 30S ribosomal protein S6 [Armatimonadota bacterium]|nr:30S ribosomal protein S6 [Armatimonadota bacterium]